MSNSKNLFKSLTPELIQIKCKTDKLVNIKKLDLWGHDLEDISLIRDMPNIENCSLSLNKIYSLKDFGACKKLTELYLRKNLISDLLEVKYLVSCSGLKVLWLQDNPIAEHPLYRTYVLKLLPNLVKLDVNAVTQEEKVEASKAAITDQDIISRTPSQHKVNLQGLTKIKKFGDEQEHYQLVEKSNIQNNPQTSNVGKSPIPIQQQTPVGNNQRNENILCAVLALLKELDESGLELVKRDIDRKITLKKQEYVAKFFAPESVIAQAREIKQFYNSQKHRMNDKEKDESGQKLTHVQPGDLILIRTPSSIYEAFRRLGESYYDHIVLPKFEDSQKEKFLSTLQDMSLGKSYDYYRVIQVLISTSIFEMKKYDGKSTDKIICSHQIYLALTKVFESLQEGVENSKDFEFNKLGTFTISDFIRLARKDKQLFETFPLYTSEELKDQKGQKDINFEGFTIQLSEEKSINKIDSMMQLFGRNKLADLIDKYTFLQSIAQKSVQIAQQLFILKKQIILLIFLYKTTDLIITAYKEYKSLNVYEKQKRTKMRLILEIIRQLSQIMIISQDYKQLTSAKIMMPMTKLMMLTYKGSKRNFTLKMMKIYNFITNLLMRAKEIFKL